MSQKTSERPSSYNSNRREKQYDNEFRNKYDLLGFKVNKKRFSHKTVSKPKTKLFSKYDQINYPNSNRTNYTYIYDSYKNQKEIFPTLVGSDIHLISQFNLDNNKDNNYKKYNKKNDVKYYYYDIGKKNPFEGPSQYEKMHKERKKIIAKVIKKEELNQLIYYFIDILYKDVDKLLNDKEGLMSYNYKISRIAKIVVFMDNIDQIKVLESMKKTADSHNKMELYERLSDEVEGINKMRKSKLRKSDFSSGVIRDGYSYRAQIRKTLKNSMK